MNIDELTRLLRQPTGHELEIGRALLAMRTNGDFPKGHNSLRGFVDSVRESVDYSTAMKWVRAAEFVAGRKDWLQSWKISPLLELLRIEDPTVREQFIAVLDSTAPVPAVRVLRGEVRRFLGEQAGPSLPTAPYEVTAQAVRIALERAGIAPSEAGLKFSQGRNADGPGAVLLTADVASFATAQALSLAGEVLGEILTVRQAWRRRPDGPPSTQHWARPLAEVDALQPGPVQVRWASPDLVHVLRAGTLIAHLPVKRVTIAKIAKPQGNRKTERVCGIIDSIHLGCLRRATGLPQCDIPCYKISDVSPGCFANAGEYPANKENQRKVFDVSHNGLVNDLLAIRLPVTGDASLRRYRKTSSTRDPMVWRVDAESADGAMGIALGTLQMWAESNPDMRFLTICSHAVSPSDAMLCWLAALSNVWTGSTVSCWFDPAELDSRFAAIRCFLDFGIPSVIWITTHHDSKWRNQELLDRALELVPAECIIEYPLKGINKQDLPLLNTNPLGACGDHRLDQGHNWFHVKRHLEGDRLVAGMEPDGHDFDYPRHPLHARCLGCQLRCGLPAVVDCLRPA